MSFSRGIMRSRRFFRAVNLAAKERIERKREERERHVHLDFYVLCVLSRPWCSPSRSGVQSTCLHISFHYISVECASRPAAQNAMPAPAFVSFEHFVVHCPILRRFLSMSYAIPMAFLSHFYPVSIQFLYRFASCFRFNTCVFREHFEIRGRSKKYRPQTRSQAHVRHSSDCPSCSPLRAPSPLTPLLPRTKLLCNTK